ncbi:TonB-dependent receptor [Bradyrhizobium sp.]|jgi:outer membrane receptor protein involved in Fe transport|uniref:TonB-dependent receptor n=1 Tax=Bradyrhizobium sp. TaxID=376 RepID=UPI003C18DBFA
MRIRGLLIASLAAATAITESEQACAQDSQNKGSYTTELPSVEVAPAETGARSVARRPRTPAQPTTAARQPTVTRLQVYPTTPASTPSTALAVDKVPSSINFVNTPEIQRTNSLNVMDALQQNVAGVNLSNVAGNEFQSNLEFRGFVASPVSGKPQGLAVYQNGVRINEAFGDTVNWDLIPTAAIKSIAVVTNNPAYGLNALGGAVTIQMKDGFNYHGAEVDVMGGAFGRLQSSLQWGNQIGNWAVYGALEGVHDDGYRNFGTSDVRRFYGDIGYRYDGNEIHLNMGAADNSFGAAATTPLELLQTYWGATYTTPQTSTNQVGYLNLTGKFEVTPTWTIDAIAHYRAFSQRTQDGNPTGTQPCDADATLLCYGDGSTPAKGLNGQQLSNPFPAGAILGENDRTFTTSNTGGFSLQATNSDQLFGHDNRFVVGASFDASVTHFGASAELGTIDTNYVVSSSGIFLGTSGVPIADGPVGLRSTNQYTGLYALDTFDVTKAFSITAGGRFNDARISLQDETGSAPALNGNEAFDRFNPIIGGTYKIMSGLTAYAGYSEANRAPTPLELECANPNMPCIIATFLVSDPPLKQVVSHTYEAGFRGTKDLSFGTLDWKLGVFRATNTDDILAIPSLVQGFGYFQNVGDTRRQGVEAEANFKSSRWQFHASYAFIDARFLDSLTLGSNSPFVDANGNIQVSPGNIIPAIPRHRIKAGFDYAVTDAFKIGGDALWVSSQYLVGDESNQYPQLPSYAVFNVHASYQLDKTYQIYGRIDNLFDNRYYTYGGFFDTTEVPNFNTGNQFANPQSLSPARPRAFYAGLKATF